MAKLKVLDLFSGIGGFSLGLDRTGGFETVAFCEIEPYPRAVLKKHWPKVPCYEDVRDRQFVRGEADIITAGFPCQDLSFAGRRAGITGKRSGLYREVVRALRLVRPKYAIVENVAALLTGGMGRVLGDVAALRYDAEWDCISASDCGAPHGRDRVWITLTDTDRRQQSVWDAESHGRRIGRKAKTQEAGNANGLRKLQPPRLLGDIRRRVDNAARGRAWWSSDWQEKFTSLRRMDDELSAGLDKHDGPKAVKALGNTIVPIAPELIGRAILQAEGRT